MSGASRSYLIIQATNSINAQLQSHSAPLKYLLQVVGLLLRKILVSTWLWKTKFSTSHRWLRVEMPMLSLSVKDLYLYLVVFQGSRDCAQLKSTTFERTNGHKLLQWRTKDIIWVHALLVTSTYMHLEVSLDLLNKKSMIALRCTKLRKIYGKFWPQGWRIHFGRVVL